MDRHEKWMNGTEPKEKNKLPESSERVCRHGTADHEAMAARFVALHCAGQLAANGDWLEVS